MGHRLSRIYTRTGDQGTTGLGDGTRVDKDCARVEAIGALDETNSLLGLVLAHDISASLRKHLHNIQHDLFDLGGELCIPGHAAMITPEKIAVLEEALETLNADLPHLKEFILPGGGQAAATCHLARAVCRRAERRLLTLSRAETINPQALPYLNRLSDLLFVIARKLSREAGEPEEQWRHN